MYRPQSTDELNQISAPPAPFRMSAEDQRILQQCNKEAFYKRCLPLCSLFGGLTYFAVKAGHLRGNATWGPLPKVAAAVFASYFMGKISYQQVCAERFMAIPDSPLGQMLRERRQQGGGGVFQESLPGYGLPNTGKVDESPLAVYQDDLGPRTFTDLDTDRPYNEGLNDSFRLNVDSPQHPEDFVLPPQAATPNTYDEMRRKNREEWERKTAPYRPQSSQVEPPRRYPSSQPEPSENSGSFSQYRPSTNIYGDVFDK